MVTREGRPISADIRWGLRWGIAFATGYSLLGAIPAIIRAIAGSTTVGGRVVSFAAILTVYVVSGVAGGVVVGLLRPVLPNVVGAATAGILCAVPMALAIRIAVYGLQGWSSNDLLATCIFAVLLGGGGGLIIWREDRRG